jgi:hypothetical protein
MRRLWLGLALAGMVVAVSACSPKTQAALADEQKNGAHFATWRHMGYSVFRGTPESTTKQDIQRSQSDECLGMNVKCKWWGEVVRVQPIQ